MSGCKFSNGRRLVVAMAVAVACGWGLCRPASAQDFAGAGVERHVPELARYLADAEIYAAIRDRNLAIYPVRLHDGHSLRGSWMTMDQALARGILTVSEKGSGGQVPFVIVENRSRHEHVFLLAGEILSGGKQTRTVRQDVVLAPGQRVELSVFCVEARRWEGAAKFDAGRALVPQSLRGELNSGVDQQRIWAEIARNNAALDAENRTESLEVALNAPHVRRRLDEVRGRIVPDVPADTVGILVLDNGRPVAADFFGSPSLARALLPKLLDSVSVDLILKRNDSVDERRAPDDAAAILFFERIRRVGSQRAATPGSGAGIVTHGDGLRGAGVSLDDTLVHFGVHTQAKIMPLPQPRPIIRPRGE